MSFTVSSRKKSVHTWFQSVFFVKIDPLSLQSQLLSTIKEIIFHSCRLLFKINPPFKKKQKWKQQKQQKQNQNLSIKYTHLVCSQLKNKFKLRVHFLEHIFNDKLNLALKMLEIINVKDIKKLDKNPEFRFINYG